MKTATVFAYWLLTVLFVLAVLAVPSCIAAAIWTEDGRWTASALTAFLAAIVFVGLAATLEDKE